MQRDSVQNTFKVAILLCLVCSVIVSSLAVGLRSTQIEQKQAFRQQNILTAAGLWNAEADSAADAKRLFESSIKAVVVDLETNKETNKFLFKGGKTKKRRRRLPPLL